MKKQIKRFSKSTLAVVLTLCMLLSCVTVGIISTNAAQVGSDSTGANAYLHYSSTDTGFGNNPTNVGIDSTVTLDSVAKGAFYVRVDGNPNNSTDDNWISSVDLGSNVYDDGTGENNNCKYRRLYFGKAMTNVKFTYSNGKLTVTTEPTYTITTSAGAGGSLSANMSRAAANEEVTLTITPDRGKELDTLTVKGSDDTDITVSGSGDTRTFTMPAKAVTATATFTDAASTLVTAQQVTDGNGKIKISLNNGGGSATATTSASATLAAYSGELLTVTVSPDRGYAVDTLYIKVGSDPESAYTNTSSKTLTIGSDAVVVRATFKVGSSSSNHFTATAGSSITDKLGDDQGDLFLLNGTFYDYYTNNEISGGWITGIQSSDRGKAASCTPYNTFNSAIRDYTYGGDIKYPLYFLNSQKGDEAINAYSNTNPTGWNYYKQVNNSMGSGLNTAVTGLTGLKLNNGLPTHYKSGATDENGVDMKIFDEDWLSGGNSQSTTLATIVDSPFPVVKRQTLKGNDYYEFNSNGAADNIWFTNLTPVYDNSSISGNVHATWGDGDATWYAILWSSSQSNSFKYVALNPDSNHDYSLVNPNKNYYDKFLLARVNTSATPPTDGTWIGDGNVYNKTADQNWPNGLDNKLIFNTTGWGSPMGTEWKPDTSATSSRQQIYVNYGSGEDNGVKSPSFGKSGGTWGFFPFDHNTSDGEAWDLGFATKLEIKFTVSEDGTIGEGSNKENQQFYFSGDDDLWVFIDDELVLDLGGNHRMTEGYIDFATKKAHANNSTVAYQGSMVRNDQNGSTFTLDNTKSYHTMTLFYMERGMFDSNLKFGFSFTPLTDLLDVETKVDVSAVNEGLRTQIASKDTFGYTVSDSTNNTKGKNASYTIYNVSNDTQVGTSSYTTNDSGVFNQGIKDGQYAQFKKAFTVGDTISVTETDPNTSGGLKYTTSYKVVDKEITSGDNEVTHGSGTSTGGFSYRTIKENSDPHVDLTHLRAIFTNKVETKNLTITKEISNKYDPDVEFLIMVGISVGEDALNTNSLQFYRDGSSTAETFSGGKAYIKQGEEIEIRGIPKGARVTVTETTPMPDNYSFVSIDNDAHSVNGNLKTDHSLTLNTDDYVTIVNKIAEKDLIITKALDSDIVDYSSPFKVKVFRSDDNGDTYTQVKDTLEYIHFEWNESSSSYVQEPGTLSATGTDYQYEIHNGSQLKIPNLPVGTMIKVVETDCVPEYYTYKTMKIAGGATLDRDDATRTGTVTMGSSAATLTIQNEAIRETIVIKKTTDYDQDNSLFGIKVEMVQFRSNGDLTPNNNGKYKELETDPTWLDHDSSHGDGIYKVKKSGQIQFERVPRGTIVQITETIGISRVTGNQRFTPDYVHVTNCVGVNPDDTQFNKSWSSRATKPGGQVDVVVNNKVMKNDVIITKNIKDADDTDTVHKLKVIITKDSGDIGGTPYSTITYTSSIHGQDTIDNDGTPEIPIVENETLTFADYPVGTHFEVTETATGANYEFDSFEAQSVTSKDIDGSKITFKTTKTTGGDNVTINNKLANRNVTVKKVVSNYTTSDKFTILIEKSTDGGSTYTALANESFTSTDGNRTALTTNRSGETKISQDEILTFKLHVSDYIRISEVLNDRPEYDCTSVAVTSGATGTDYSATGLKGTIFRVGTTDASVVVTNALKDYKYKIVYNYEAYSATTYTSKTEKDDDHRVVGPIRSYTQKGVISQDDRDYFFNINKTTKEITFQTDDLRKEFISKHAPYEDDFMMDVKWLDEENPKSASYDSTTSTISLETTATSQPDRAVKVYFKMPYDVDSNLAATGDTKKTAVVQDTVTTQYGNWVIMGGDFVTAPRTLNDNGTTSYFQYWQITFITGSDEHGDKVANNTKKCYYDKFNMTMYQDSYVEPIYMTEAEGGSTEFKPNDASYEDTKDGEATISFIETSRSSWNEDGAPDQTDNTKKKAGDRVYSDFLLTFGYKDKQLNTYKGSNVEGSNVKLGFVVEKVAVLDQNTETGNYETKSQKYYQNKYGATTGENVTKFISGTLESPHGFLMNQNIAFSSLDNKNQMKYSLDMKNKEFGEREEPTDPYRNYVYRAYSYTRIGDNVVVSTPVYFTIYDMASIETV